MVGCCIKKTYYKCEICGSELYQTLNGLQILNMSPEEYEERMKDTEAIKFTYCNELKNQPLNK